MENTGTTSRTFPKHNTNFIKNNNELSPIAIRTLSEKRPPTDHNSISFIFAEKYIDNNHGVIV